MWGKVWGKMKNGPERPVFTDDLAEGEADFLFWTISDNAVRNMDKSAQMP